MEYRCKTCGVDLPDRAIAEIHLISMHVDEYMMQLMWMKHIVKGDK